MRKRIVLLTKKSLAALIIAVFLLCISNNAEALPIRYNIIEGVDTEGYNFSGYVDIESDPTFTDGLLQYNITSFLFSSYGGTNYGTSGELWFRFADPIKNVVYPGSSTVHFYSDYMVNYVEKDNVTRWSNAATGLWFIGVEPTFDAYSYLPEKIQFLSGYIIGQYGIGTNYWGPGSGIITLNRVSCEPIPEPSTMLLLGTGLLCLAGSRMKLMR